MINNIIDVAKGFQTSVNIAYDLYNDEKVKSFIPTASSIDVIEQIMLSTSAESTQRARILVGAYGRGKSHIILMLVSILFKKDKAIFRGLLERIKRDNRDLYDYIVDYLNSDRKLLPVVIGGSNTSLTQSFLNALQISLNKAGLKDIMPDTHFHAAINAIQTWKSKYPETYKKFTNEIHLPVDEFVLALKQYDVNTYDRFIDLYPVLTSGSVFNPFIGFDVVELYEKVIDELPQHGYEGMFIVYDEFSKYLEASITNATISDIKLLQDFAEKCDRSGKRQMHLMLICHKDIGNYIDLELPREKVDGWRGVSGRFKHMNLHNDYAQTYDVISSVITKKETHWKEFCEVNRSKFENITSRFLANKLFDNEQSTELCVYGCYPLHPYSTFLLPRISERVAQNERTLFTFLSSEGRHTLSDFVESSDSLFPLLTPDFIYDYFEPLLRKEPYTSNLHKLYKLSASILSRLEEGSLGARIVKTITLIYAVEQFEKLAPVYDVIIDTYLDFVSDRNLIDETLKTLIEKDCIVYLKRSNGYLKLKESSGVDIPNEIARMTTEVRTKSSCADILNSINPDNYVYPNRYNDEFEMIRYFAFRFIKSDEYWEDTSWREKLQTSTSDGLVYGIIPESEDDIKKIKVHLKTHKEDTGRILFILPKNQFSIEDSVYEYEAAKLLKEQAEEDELLADEYDVYIEDLEEVVFGFISSYSRPELHKATYYNNGEEYHFARKAQLSALLSDICYDVFPRTPIINNESINKNDLPTVAKNSRAKILAGLLGDALNPNLGLIGNGQDVSMMRSTLVRTGILENYNSNPKINMHPEDKNLAYTLATIDRFITSCKPSNEGCFSALYQSLTGPEGGIGLRLGVIPIFIGVVLHKHRKQVVIKHNGDEAKLSAELLTDINGNPSEYSVFLDGLDEERVLYLKELEMIFSDYIIEREKSYNSYTYITNAMTRWYMSLPKYSKELTMIYQGINAKSDKFRAISRSNLRFLKSIRQPITNAREYLFEGIFENFGMKDFNIDILTNVGAAKAEYDTALSCLVQTLIGDTKHLFGEPGNSKATLSSILKEWTHKLNETTRNHLFPYNENQVIELFSLYEIDDISLVKKLCKCVTSLRVEDWNYDTIDDYFDALLEFKKTVERIDSTPTKQNQVNTYKLSFIDDSGNEVLKTFERSEYSKRARLLYNEIQTAVDDMGQSISGQEKRQVLIEILEKLC